MQYPVRSGPVVNDAAPFTSSMVQGTAPPATSRGYLPLRTGWTSAQTTHVQAPFSPEMIRGAAPSAPVRLEPPQDWIGIAPDVPVFSIEMIVGVIPPRPRVFLAPRIPLPLSQPTHDAAAFSVEMAQGWQPLRSREWLPLRVGWASAQLTPVAAPVTSSMTQGWSPERNREVLPLRTGWREFPLTHVQAPFSIEMIRGSSPPERDRGYLPLRVGWTVTQHTPVAAPFSIEMIVGSVPPAPLRLRGFPGWVGVPPEVLLFSVEMAQGSMPQRPRLFLAPRLPLPWSQTTHTEAPFSPEMIQGFLARTALRLDLRPRLGWTVLPPEVAAFSIEMAIGWGPVAPRLFLAPRLLTPLSQTTHVPAPFSPEMAQGWNAVRHPVTDPGRFRWTAFLMEGTPDVVAVTLIHDRFTLGSKESLSITPDPTLGGRWSW